MRTVWMLTSLGMLLILGCTGSNESVAPLEVPKAKPIGAPSDDVTTGQSRASAERLIGGVKFQIPPDWEEKTLSNSFVLAEFSVPGNAGSGRLTMSTAGGGTQENIERWKGQFRRGPGDAEPNESEIRAAGKTAVLVEAYGTFTDMRDQSQNPNWQLLGVAIPIDAEHNYFVKLAGPRETVTARRDEFLKFVESARFE